MNVPDVLCEGIGMRTCDGCARNVDHYPGAAPARLLDPAAKPPTQCADWRPLPHGFVRGQRAEVRT